jgi:hypothetical protein
MVKFSERFINYINSNARVIALDIDGCEVEDNRELIGSDIIDFEYVEGGKIAIRTTYESIF